MDEKCLATFSLESESGLLRETMPTSWVDMNDGRFASILAASSYVNPWQVYWAGLWDKCRQSVHVVKAYLFHDLYILLSGGEFYDMNLKSLVLIHESIFIAYYYYVYKKYL